MAVLGEYASGKRIGIWTRFHENGSVWKIQHFDESAENEFMIGEYRENYDNGQLQQRGFYQGGQRNNLWIEYYDNGQVREKVTWKDGHRHGPYEEYEQSGALKSKGMFHVGEKCGSWVEQEDQVQYASCPGE